MAPQTDSKDGEEGDEDPECDAHFTKICSLPLPEQAMVVRAFTHTYIYICI